MKKADLAAAVRSVHGGVTGAEAGLIVDTIFQKVADGLATGRTLKIRRFGSLEVHLRGPRRGRDLHTGRVFFSSALRKPFFRPSVHLLRSLQP